MLPDAQKEIIEICQERNIPYVSMKKIRIYLKWKNAPSNNKN